MSDGSPFCSTCGANLGTPAMPPMMQTAQRTSGLAIAGFVCAFFCSLLGLILSIIGLSEINKSNGAVKGRGLAIAGIVISSLSFVIGILAAVAIPAFVDYTKKAKKSEAALQLNKIGKNAKTYYITNAEFPKGHAALTPAAACCPQPGAKCAVDNAAWQAKTWQDLDFQIDEPGHYQYRYDGDGQSADVEAVGDLDCDGEMATYHLHLGVQSGNPTMTITEPPPGVY